MEEYKSHTIIAEAIHIYKQNLPAHQPLISSGKREFKKKEKKTTAHIQNNNNTDMYGKSNRG